MPKTMTRISTPGPITIHLQGWCVGPRDCMSVGWLDDEMQSVDGGHANARALRHFALRHRVPQLAVHEHFAAGRGEHGLRHADLADHPFFAGFDATVS